MMKKLFLIFALLDFVLATNIKVSAEKHFIPFIKSLEREGIHFTIQDKNSSLEAFEDIKNNKTTFAIVRGDILADNMKSKNFFKDNSFQNFKVISKLKPELSTFLYLVSKNRVNDAFELLNPEDGSNGIKKISIGYLKDLSIFYLSDIAKSINAEYRFHYRSFSPEESFKKLREGELDACYLFLSEKEKNAQSDFKFQNILKPLKIKPENFAKQLLEQKAFEPLNNGIRVDNYLISTTSTSENELFSLIYSLKEEGALIETGSGVGEKDRTVDSMSQKIDIEQEESKVKEEIKDKECKEAQSKIRQFASRKASLKGYTQHTTKKIKQLLSNLSSTPEYGFFVPRVHSLLDIVIQNNKEASKLSKEIQKSLIVCDTISMGLKLDELKDKTDEIKSIEKDLASLESEILRQAQLDEKELAYKLEQNIMRNEAEEKALELALAAEERIIEAQLEAQLAAEERLKKLEESKGIFETIKKAIGL